MADLGQDVAPGDGRVDAADVDRAAGPQPRVAERHAAQDDLRRHAEIERRLGEPEGDVVIARTFVEEGPLAAAADRVRRDLGRHRPPRAGAGRGPLVGLEPVDVPAPRRDAPERRVAVRLDVGLDERPAEHERHGRAGALERDETQDVAVDVDEQPGALAHVEQQLEVGLAGLDDAWLRRPVGASVDVQAGPAREIAGQARRADIEVDARAAVLAQAMEAVVGADADDAAAIGLIRPLDRGDLTVEQRLVLLGHPETERGARRSRSRRRPRRVPGRRR